MISPPPLPLNRLAANFQESSWSLGRMFHLAPASQNSDTNALPSPITSLETFKYVHSFSWSLCCSACLHRGFFMITPLDRQRVEISPKICSRLTYFSVSLVESLLVNQHLAHWRHDFQRTWPHSCVFSCTWNCHKHIASNSKWVYNPNTIHNQKRTNHQEYEPERESERVHLTPLLPFSNWSAEIPARESQVDPLPSKIIIIPSPSKPRCLGWLPSIRYQVLWSTMVLASTNPVHAKR